MSPKSDEHALLLRAAELLHRFGTPSHRLERVMAKVSHSLGIVGVFLYTPTALVISLGDGNEETTYLRRVDAGPIDISKLIAFDDILDEAEAHTLTPSEALQRFEAAAASPPPFGVVATALAYATVCGCVAILFGGRGIEAAVAAALGCLFYWLGDATARWSWERGLLEPLVAALGAVLALLVARFVVPLDDRLTTLASLIVLLPGLSLTIAMTELAVGHVSAGVARLAGSLTTLFILVMGVGIAWRLASDLRTMPPLPFAPLPGWAVLLALLLTPACFAILFRARYPQWPIIYLAALSGYGVHWWVNAEFGGGIGAFVGALTVGCISNLYARIRDRPSLIPSTPGMIILVPGSLGYRSLTTMLESDAVTGTEYAFNTILIAFSLAGGLLAASALVPPKRIL
jgi:uncharacterized membrane protein YjjP (DUF1212 family)